MLAASPQGAGRTAEIDAATQKCAPQPTCGCSATPSIPIAESHIPCPRAVSRASAKLHALPISHHRDRIRQSLEHLGVVLVRRAHVCCQRNPSPFRAQVVIVPSTNRIPRSTPRSGLRDLPARRFISAVTGSIFCHSSNGKISRSIRLHSVSENICTR